jgi:hypothetical protein
MTNTRETRAPHDPTRIERDPIQPVLWIIAIGLFVAGAGLTALSLLLPLTSDLTLERVLTTGGGVLLTALGGVLASFLTTRVSATREVEAQHVRFLGGAARNLAAIYHGLQEATAKRRNGAFTYEETYQEAVLMSANSVLAEFDSITMLSGRIQGAFRDSMADLDEIRSVFSSGDLIVATTLAAQHAAAPLQEAEPISTTCPVCASRTTGHLALRAGWTSTLVCSHCKTSFLVHRKADLTVYVGRITHRGSGAPDVAPVAKNEDPGHAPSDPIVVDCPTCSTNIRINTESERTTTTTKRICIQCASIVTISLTEGVVKSVSLGAFVDPVIVGRHHAHPKIRCNNDGYELVASFKRNSDAAWVAICSTHLVAYAVTRETYRTWLASEDPDYLAARLDLESNGGVRIVSDPVE